MTKLNLPEQVLKWQVIGPLALLLAAWARAEAADPVGTAPDSPAPTAVPQRLEKAAISFRIAPGQWMPPERFQQLLELLERYRGATDEITLFTSATHPPLPLEEIKKRCELLAQRMPQARALGYRAGINVLATMGHHNENLRHSLAADFTRVTDIDGNISQGSFCPNDPRFHEYVRELYRLVARAEPDFIWIDDDVRLAGHMPVGQTCFCDRCLEMFAAQTGSIHTRASMKTGLFEDRNDARLALRSAWLAHNRATIQRLLELVERTVHEERPNMPLGFMTGERFYEGYDFGSWARALSGPKRVPVYWRPGGGFYEDSLTGGLAGKSHEIGRQVSLLPADVIAIQSEIENFPYHRLRKSAHMTVLEAASHMGAGCTGAAFNVLSGSSEPLDEFEPMVAAIHRSRPFYDLLARHQGRAPPIGLHAAWNIDSWVADPAMLRLAPTVWEIGLPAAYVADGAAVTLLFPQSIVTMTDDQIRRILATAVYMDAETLSALDRRGFASWIGIDVGDVLHEDCIEEFTAHPLNHPFAGRRRDGRQSFYHEPAYALRPADPAAQVLSRLVDYADREKAACSMAVFENSQGGRIAVSGYFPWSFLHNQSKSSQMKSVMRWLSRDRLPAYVSSYHKINLWVREPSQGQLVVTMINSSFDTATEPVVVLRTANEKIRVFDETGNETIVPAGRTDGPYRHFTLPAIEPWSVRLAVTSP